jgi:hypothetical protein
MPSCCRIVTCRAAAAADTRRLNAIRSAPGGLLHLLKLFEDLLRSHHPQMVLRLAEMGVQVRINTDRSLVLCTNTPAAHHTT